MITELDELEVEGRVGPLRSLAMGRRNGSTPVLFLHPVNTAGRIWEGLACVLQPPRYCLLPDLRGHGRSVKRGPFSVHDYVEDALAVLDATGVERAHVVGGSLGGPVAVALAVRAPERVASLAAFGSMLSLPVSPQDLETVAQTIRSLGTRGYFEQIAPDTLGPTADTALVERVVALAAGEARTPEMVTAILLNALSTDVTDLAARVVCPSLVVTGEHDAWCTPAVGRVMAEHLSGHHRVLPDLGHLPMLEAPALLASMLDEHFSAAEA